MAFREGRVTRCPRRGRYVPAVLIGFVAMVVVGGAIIYGFTLALGLVFELLLGGH